MNIIIQSLGFTAGKELEDYIREKLQKIERHADNIIRADVTLFLGPQSSPDNCHCEIRLEVPGHDPFVKKSANTFEMAVVDVTETLDKILQKNKDKMISGRQV